MCAAYAGDLSPADAWEFMRQGRRCVLIDVRTEPEWRFVGFADVSSLDQHAAMISWQEYPSMEINPRFMDQVDEAAGSKETAVLFLCRSGARSRNAAIAATAAGYREAYNVAEGFEGDLDAENHRGRVNGWKVAGLPWRQG